jgi:hypothetical protein
MPAARALRGEEAVDVPLVITTADGRRLHVLATASPVRDGTTIVGAFSVPQDVSTLEAARADADTAAEELRMQEEELVRAGIENDRQRRLLDAILAAVPYRVSLWDRDERIPGSTNSSPANRACPARTW